MQKKIIWWSVGGVVSAAATFAAGYFTGLSLERKKKQQDRQQPQQSQNQHAQA